MKLTILSKEDPQDREIRSFFGRIEDTISCFQDLLTFSRHSTKQQTQVYKGFDPIVGVYACYAIKV